MSTLKVTKVSRTCTGSTTKVKMTMRRLSDARKREGKGGSRRTLITSMKSSSQISSPALDNRQMLILVRAMLRNKNSKQMDSISIRLETVGRKDRVMGWSFMGKMCMFA